MGCSAATVTSALTTNTSYLSFGYYCYTKERGKLFLLHNLYLYVRPQCYYCYTKERGKLFLLHSLYLYVRPQCYYCVTKERGKLFLLHTLYLYIRALYFFGSIITLNTYISYFYLLEKHNIKDLQCRATDSIKGENTFIKLLCSKPRFTM